MLRKMLVIDDSAIIHKLYHLILARYGCEVVDAMDGREGLRLLSAHGDLDLIILDLNMPGMNGVEFMKAAREVFPRRVPIIIISSSDGQDCHAIPGLHLEGTFYLKKPFDPSDLHRLVETITGHAQNAPRPAFVQAHP